MDSEADPEANVRAALARGLAGIAFTEHFDTHPTEWPLCRYDYDAIRETVASLRSKYGDRLFIGHGIEICYQPERMDFILDYLASHEFDIVLLSVHWFDGRALHVREHWGDLDSRAATEAYLKTVLNAAQFAGSLVRDGRRVFDVLGHLDLAKRYTTRYFGEITVTPFRGLVDDILRAALAADLIPEINTSTWQPGGGEPMPAEWVVQRYAELGGRCMSLGSDSHRADHIGHMLPEAAAMLRRAGIMDAAVFRRRELERVPLPETHAASTATDR